MVKKSFSCGKAGFTLIELLVVIAIIAILAALLLPVLERAKAEAHKNRCITNLKSIVMAVHLYAMDYDSNAPMLQLASPGLQLPETFDYVWQYLLAPYLGRKDLPPLGTASLWKTMDVFCCPAGPFNYGWNAWIGGRTEEYQIGSSANQAYKLKMPAGPGKWKRLQYPSETIVVFDNHLRGVHDNWDWFFYYFLKTYSGLNTAEKYWSHHPPGGLNFGFADGSAKWICWRHKRWERTGHAYTNPTFPNGSTEPIQASTGEWLRFY